MAEETSDLLRRAAERDSEAIDRLLEQHRERLRQMVAFRIDARLRQRFDPSDVVQETLIEAVQRLPHFFKQSEITFYPWLRELALNRMIDLHRRHAVAQKRSVAREEASRRLPEESVMHLARRLAGSGTSPSRQFDRREQRERLHARLNELPSQLREVLVLKYLEQLPAAEIAEVLGVSDRTVRRWHRQALEQMEDLLGT